jgi:hypothetical protein
MRTDPTYQRLLAEAEAYRQETERIYQQINDMWAGQWYGPNPHGIGLVHYKSPPTMVYGTPHWQEGWSLFQGWAKKYDHHPLGNPPFGDTRWANEVHIKSHLFYRWEILQEAVQKGRLPVRAYYVAHCRRHAEIELEVTRLIIDWWHRRKVDWSPLLTPLRVADGPSIDREPHATNASAAG